MSLNQGVFPSKVGKKLPGNEDEGKLHFIFVYFD